MRAGVLGHPIDHSLSPLLHRAAYRELGLDWTYDAHDVTADSLPAFIEAVDRSWAGLSLTMPLKVAAVGLMDFVEPMAKLLGIVNTVVVAFAGTQRQLVGANTDVYGVVEALREVGVSQAGSAVILGGGATATSALAALGQLKATSIVVGARDRSRAAGVLRAATKMGITLRIVTVEEAVLLSEQADVVVSTVPHEALDGMRPLEVTSKAILLDAIYAPPVSAFAQQWMEAGGVHVAGYRMLLHQAAEQVRLMTGREAPLGAMDSALMSYLGTE